MRIHKEGYRLIAVLLMLIVLILAFVWSASWNIIPQILISLFLTICWLFVINFFRIPSRKLTNVSNGIIAPCDGLVVAADPVDEPDFFQASHTRIAIFMAGTDVHINWIPMSGRVSYYRYIPGQHLLARNPKSSHKNERTIMGIEHESGHKILVKQIAGIMARRVVSYVKPGDLVQQGDEMGFIKFGSRVEVFLSKELKAMVKPGDRVIGGETLLASCT